MPVQEGNLNRRTFFATISALAALPAGAKPQPRLDVRNIPVSYFPKFDLKAVFDAYKRTRKERQLEVLCGTDVLQRALGAVRFIAYCVIPNSSNFISRDELCIAVGEDIVSLRSPQLASPPNNTVWLVDQEPDGNYRVLHVLVFGDIPSKGKR